VKITHWALVGASVFSSGLLLFSGWKHAWSPEAFRAAVTNQGLVPYRQIAVHTKVFTAMELLFGLCGLAAAGSTGSTITAAFSSPALMAVSGLYFAMALYIMRLLQTGTGAPCGCFGGDAVANYWTVLRAVSLGFAPLTLSISVADLSILAAVAIVFGLAVLVGFLLTLTGRKQISPWAPRTDLAPQGSEAK